MRIYITVFFIMLGFSSVAQTISSEKSGHIIAYRVENGDTMYYASIPELIIRTPRKFRNAADERQFWRLVANVKRVYPYAQFAGIKMHELNEHYLSINSDRERREYSRKVEEELKAEFEGELRKLSITQGRILMRLVDRETGHTTYEIVRDFRGSVQVVFWQALARVFGHNLRTNYDPSSGEDRMIELIIREIDEGWL